MSFSVRSCWWPRPPNSLFPARQNLDFTYVDPNVDPGHLGVSVKDGTLGRVLLGALVLPCCSVFLASDWFQNS